MKPQNMPYIPISNLPEAKESLAKLLPHLPWPRLIERMNPCGIAMPVIGMDKNLVVLEQPEALLQKLGPFADCPKAWLQAYRFHKQRRIRNAQLMRLHPECAKADFAEDAMEQGYVPDDVDEADGLVAGVLLLAIKPVPSELRNILLSRAQTDWWGAFFALQGTIYNNESDLLLNCVAMEPRLSAALWHHNHELAGPLGETAMMRSDIWSATVALRHPLASQWLCRVCTAGRVNPLAAVTGIALQPHTTTDQRQAWVEKLQSDHPLLAYLAVRWAKHTWDEAEWKNLRDQLRQNAVGDKGQAWFHWHRDCEPERIDDAARESDVHTLWLAELIHHARNEGQELRRRMAERLQKDGNDHEALMTLRWLSRRGRLHD
jgi:hypothetical protein